MLYEHSLKILYEIRRCLSDYSVATGSCVARMRQAGQLSRELESLSGSAHHGISTSQKLGF